MTPNSSSTTGCDQILKQMMYGRRKLERREHLGEGERKRERERYYGGAGHYIISVLIHSGFLEMF